ncbi:MULTISPECIES: acyl-CoA thioesterase [Marinobacter]|uniref:Acyl-CoA thioesterase n=1 Tax=Marinobacter xiaoshiensis TaxID=3073652 RepID=A0ABU2HKB9_9GAMM|nr:MULTISPECIES: acyl-CoA thioesterase [unclassified Marinobacter]MBK1874235.1 acyl-CoA thioesterase [Marinobacter sp. 1-3A]MBK1886639.1 acyl-CoA thioesterase [Marinobacter sp. DY40_1A1]MDS1311527.1 acyl-CoA thioesterase [Marinobacter sp. F60267]
MALGSSTLTMTVLMTPDKANFSGNVHGGTLLKYLDEVAYACASRYAGNYVVTLSVDQVTFRQPVHVGELVTFLASVNYTGNTSMEVGIKVITENIQEQMVRHTNSCFFTMVAVDETGATVKVPPLEPRTEDEIRRFANGKERRAIRAELAERYKSLEAAKA